MDRSTAIIITLVVYKVVLLALGIWGARRTRDTTDYYLGGRTLGPWVAAISASASGASAWTILGVSGAAFASGLSALWIFPACVGGIAFNWLVLAPGVRRLSLKRNALTITELLAGPPGSRLSAPIRIIASLIIIVSLGFYVCSQFQGAGKTFGATFDIERTESVLLGAGIVVLYTMVGGFWAVSLTDTLQGLLMAATAVALPIAALVEVGGIGGLIDGLQQTSPDYLSITKDMPLWAGIGFVAGSLGIGLGFPGQPHIIVRLMALRAGAQAIRQARFIALGWSVIVFTGMLLLGFCGRLLLPGLLDGEQVFVEATNILFSPVVAGVVIAAVLSAIMSTADSQLLVASSSVTQDLGLGGSNSRTMLLRSRLVVLTLSAGAVIAAVVNDESIFNQVLFAWGAMGAAFGPLLIVTVLRGPVSPVRTLLAMVVGCTASVVAYRSGLQDSEKYIERVVPYLLAFAVIYCPTPGRRRTS
ncbi:MAG: sodium/proline symporter [Planctomycetota bacterium]|jgi:sodium/proline symporter|nr:sodium/proline symporter [Planctomycetota bacterium]